MDDQKSVPPAKPGQWVAGEDRIGKVREAHPADELDASGYYDIVLYARDGSLIGRESPAMGGPRGFEPFCSAAHWRPIRKPAFPLTRFAYLRELVTFLDA